MRLANILLESIRRNHHSSFYSGFQFQGYILTCFLFFGGSQEQTRLFLACEIGLSFRNGMGIVSELLTWARGFRARVSGIDWQGVVNG